MEEISFQIPSRFLFDFFSSSLLFLCFFQDPFQFIKITSPRSLKDPFGFILRSFKISSYILPSSYQLFSFSQQLETSNYEGTWKGNE